MRNISEAVSELKNQILVPLDGVTEQELSTVSNRNDHNAYDPTADFRLSILERYDGKVTIKKLYACYYQGWEMDMWAADIVTQEGVTYRIETCHGVIRQTEMINEKI